ncbi:MAG TPA: amidohydrolase family protein [Rhizomicrobium sp.]|nr:amidohydrolase family protein [Rhizomicrobium sp.]
MAKYDRVIKNGIIVDGTRQPRFRGDIGISNGLIAKIGSIDESDAGEILDASGLIVAPGFVDLHTHYDSQVFWDPYCTISGWHGVTSVVIGNCGFGFAPVKPEEREYAMLSMTRVEAIPLAAMKAGMPWDWVTFPEFLDSIERTPKSVNILPYVPLGPLMIWVMGLKDAKAGRMPTPAEHAEMGRLLNQAMDAGACGWSAQRLVPGNPGGQQNDHDGTPMVTDVMHDETAIEMAKVLRKRNDGFIQMTLLSPDPGHDRKHIEDLATVSGRPVVMNVVGWNDSDASIHRDTLAWLKSCRDRGIRVVGQGDTVAAPWMFKLDEWNMFDDSEAWKDATLGTFEERKAKMADPARRAALREVPKTVIPVFGEIVLIGPKTEKNEKWRDYTLAHIAKETGKHPVDVMLDIAVEEDLQTEFQGDRARNNLKYLKEIVQDPFVIFGVSDGGAHTRFLTGGRFPTETIVRFVRENDVISLEEAHWRLSTLPALVAGFRERGTLVEGAPADVVVYDYEKLHVVDDEIARDQPGGEWRRIQRASGYRFILVNGEVTIRDDKETNTHSGDLLRHGGGRRDRGDDLLAAE